MEQLVAYLSGLPGISNVRGLEITIKGKVYIAARYCQTLATPETSPAWRAGEREYTREMIYVLGELPKHYQRRNKAAYVVPGDAREWFIAGYSGKPGTPSMKPFGPNFLIAPWNASEPIDHYERRPYDRVPLSIVELA